MTSSVMTLEEVLEVAQAAVVRVDGGVVGDVVAVVLERRGVEGQQPHGGDAQVLQVVELLGQAAEVPDAVSVRVEEGLGMDLVEDRVPVPELVRVRRHRVPSLPSSYRKVVSRPADRHTATRPARRAPGFEFGRGLDHSRRFRCTSSSCGALPLLRLLFGPLVVPPRLPALRSVGVRRVPREAFRTTGDPSPCHPLQGRPSPLDRLAEHEAERLRRLIRRDRPS
jgi:hypothetical protein